MNNSNEARCCRTLDGAEGVLSPFDKWIVLDEFDIFTKGLTRCSVCGNAYRFDAIASTAPETPERHVYTLAALDAGTFDEAVTTLAAATKTSKRPFWSRFAPELPARQTPDWPVWHPEMDGSESELEEMHLKIDGILDSARTPALLLFAAEPWSLVEKAKRVRAAELDRVKDWIAFFQEKSYSR